MTMMRNDYDAKRPLTGAKRLDLDGELAMMRNVSKHHLRAMICDN